MRAAGVRSFALFPLLREESWLGIWFVGRGRPSSFEDRLLRSFQSLASQAAGVMERIQLVETTRRQTQRERTISAIAAQLRSQATVEQVLNSTVQQIGQRLGAGRAAIRLYRHSQGEVQNVG